MFRPARMLREVKDAIIISLEFSNLCAEKKAEETTIKAKSIVAWSLKVSSYFVVVVFQNTC